jgi:hypothetical protein
MDTVSAPQWDFPWKIARQGDSQRNGCAPFDLHVKWVDGDLWLKPLKRELSSR